MILLHLIILMDTSLLLWRYEKTQKEKTYCQKQIPQIKLQVVVIYNNMMHLFRLCVVEHLPFVGYFTATYKCSQHTLFYLNTDRVFRTREAHANIPNGLHNLSSERDRKNDRHTRKIQSEKKSQFN